MCGVALIFKYSPERVAVRYPALKFKKSAQKFNACFAKILYYFVLCGPLISETFSFIFSIFIITIISYFSVKLNNVAVNQTVHIGELTAAAECDIMELEETRKKTNWIKDDRGRFARSVPEGGSGGSGGNGGKKDLTKLDGSGTIKLRVNLFDKTDPLYMDSFGIEEEDGFEDICVHGCPESVQHIIDGKPVNMSAKEFAAFLKENTAYKGGDIRLASCSTGKGENSFAQQLSKELGITVKAADSDVYFAPEEGVLFVGSPYSNIGKWRTFKNGDEIL